MEELGPWEDEKKDDLPVQELDEELNCRGVICSCAFSCG